MKSDALSITGSLLSTSMICRLVRHLLCSSLSQAITRPCLTGYSTTLMC